MEKFLAMPLPQRLLVVGIMLGLVGGLTYYLVLSPLGDAIAAQDRKYKGAMAEYAKLKEFDSPDFRERMNRERAEAMKRKAEFERMLPSEEELPGLIASLKADADAAGLVLLRFEPVKTTEVGEGYRGIPFSIELTGTFPQFVNFLKAIAAPAKRVINPRDLRIEAVAPSTLEAVAGDVGLLRLLNEREKRRGLTPQEQYVKKVLLFEEAAKQTLLKIRFTAVAFVYTGGAPAGAPK